MFFELAIGIKSIVIIVSLIGLFLGLFPEIDLFPTKQKPVIVETQPEITTVWSALVYAPDDPARDDIKETHKEEQITARQTDTNAARVAMYSAHQTTTQEKLKNNNRLMFWALVGMVGVAFPLPKRKKEGKEYE